jgi:hypothetical protein
VYACACENVAQVCIEACMHVVAMHSMFECICVSASHTTSGIISANVICVRVYNMRMHVVSTLGIREPGARGSIARFDMECIGKKSAWSTPPGWAGEWCGLPPTAGSVGWQNAIFH